MKPFITGTAAYGPFTIKSDIDVVMVYWQAAKLQIAIEAMGIEVTEPDIISNPDYRGYKFNLGQIILDVPPNNFQGLSLPGRAINIISVTPDFDYYSWRYATAMMCGHDPYSDKAERVKVFKNFRAAFNY